MDESDIVRQVVVCIAVSVLIVASSAAGIVTGSETNLNDEYPDECSIAPNVEPGTLTGSVSPEDNDAFWLPLSKGDIANVRVSFNPSRASLNIDNYIGNTIGSDFSLVETEETEASDLEISVNEVSGPEGESSVEGSFELHSEEDVDGWTCVIIHGYGATPWEFSFSVDDNEPPTLANKDEVASLRSTVEAKNERISELKSTVEQQSNRIEELKTKLNSQSSKENVTFRISVTPTNEQGFIEGEQAQVQITGARPSVLDKLELAYQGRSYKVDSEGTVTLPLDETGQHELRFSYGKTSESVTIDVQQPDNSGNENSRESTTNSATVTESTNATDESTTSTPGFGIVVIVSALVLFVVAISFRQ